MTSKAIKAGTYDEKGADAGNCKRSFTAMPGEKKHAGTTVRSTATPGVVPRLFSIAEAARYLGATTWFVEELLRNDEVRSFVLGKRRVVDSRQLDLYVDRRNAEAPRKLSDRRLNLERSA